MSKTIKELADELGISKTAIRKYMTPEFREKFTSTSETGAILVSEDGENHIKSLRKPPETTGNQFAETANQEVSGTKNSTGDPVVEALLEQLKAKDRQIEAQQVQISQLTAALENTTQSLQAAQALHAGTMKKQLKAGKDATESDDGKSWWPWSKRK